MPKLNCDVGPNRCFSFNGISRWAVIGLSLALVAGAFLRLGFGSDIEFKGDEKYNFELARDAGRTVPIPALGMNSGVNIPNPGLSVWVFVGLARLTGVDSPVGLARAIQMLNVLALVLLAFLVLKFMRGPTRETWTWAVALACVNPIDVLLQRKIWAPSVFPLLTTLMLLCWWRRDRFWYAVGWGLIGGVLGQIQMVGFAFGLSFALLTLLIDRRGVRWSGWLAGSGLATIPLLPWLQYLWTHQDQLRQSSGSSPAYAEFSLLHHPFTAWIDQNPWQYFLVWIVNALGLGLDYSLFDEVYAFLKFPYVAGWPTYGGGAAMVVIVGLAAITLAFGLRRVAGLEWRARPARHTLGMWIAFLGFGGLVAVTPYFVQRHYLLVTFPYEFVWLALVVQFAFGRTRLARAVLTSLCVCQFALAANFLWYIHANGGAPRGDYGVSYGRQLESDKYK